MQSVQESKQELEASIRYAENAISSAKATIESMEFRQEMTKKQQPKKYDIDLSGLEEMAKRWGVKIDKTEQVIDFSKLKEKK